MSFYKKYELERLIADGETKTFRAIENSSGRPVFLHMFNPEGQALLAAMKARLAKDPKNPIPPLIEMGEFAGSPYAVTEPLTPFKNLRDWLNRPAPAPAAAPAPKPAASPPPTVAPAPVMDEFEKLFGEARPPAAPATPAAPRSQGEFTKFFGPGQAAAAAKPAAQASSDEFTKMFGSAPAPPAPKPAAPAASDEFTKMFGPMPEKPAAKAPPPVSDEFTKMFGAPKPAAPRPPAAPPDPETGQFTRLFGSGPSGEAINIEEEQARAAKTAPPENRPFQAPSEFTRVFGPEHAAGGHAPAAPRPLTMGSASGIFKAQAPLSPPSAPPPPKAPGTPGESSPGEYTRMFAAPKERGGNNPAQGQPGIPPAVTPVPAPKRGMMIAVGVGVAVLLIVVFVVIAMVLHKRP